MKPVDPDKRARNAPQLTERDPTRAIVVVPELTSGSGQGEGAIARSGTARLEEAIGLALAIDLDVCHSTIARLPKIKPATFLGSGKVADLAGLVIAEKAGLIIVDAALSPIQQRNLENETSAKVIDRTGLILEIFGDRARTKEGVLQVELAHLNYQKSRLVRSWTHLERQRGGVGFLGGPGETQIEADRRQLQDRISKIRSELEQVRDHRRLQRSGRRKVPYPSVALVGYTNAGKSTLFNRLTEARVLAKDMLFATLDPTVRSISLPHGRTATLSDTVGFISDLPTDLIAAFRATLEEVLEADLILHVRDMSHEDAAQQADDVHSVLEQLGIEQASRRLIEVWNKSDLIDAETKEALAARAARADGRPPVLVSAITGEGLDALLQQIEDYLNAESALFTVQVSGIDGQALNWLYEQCEVLERQDEADTGTINLRVQVPHAAIERFKFRFGGAYQDVS